MSAYETVDKWTFGNAKHIAMLIVGIVTYLLVLVAFYFIRIGLKYGYAGFTLIYSAMYGKQGTASMGGPTTLSSLTGAESATASVGEQGDEFDF